MLYRLSILLCINPFLCRCYFSEGSSQLLLPLSCRCCFLSILNFKRLPFVEGSKVYFKGAQDHLIHKTIIDFEGKLREASALSEKAATVFLLNKKNSSLF